MDLKHHSSFKMGGKAKHFVSVTTKEELRAAVLEAKKLGTEFHIVGEGTNTVFHHKQVNKFIIKNEIPGIEISYGTYTDDSSTALVVGAGVRWDDVVAFAVDHGLSGIEAMSAIPGTAGAAPVQNIGAYGQEIKDVLVSLEAYDVEQDSFVVLRNKDCEFSYRDSIFKNPKNKNRYIITSITLKLSKFFSKIPDYPGVKEYFEAQEIPLEKVSLSEVREAITHIRKHKLPDPSVVPNCGSFFKNAIISNDHFEVLLKKYPNIPHFPSGHLIKIPTGWLLEQAGFKDKTFGNFKTHDKNALVMTHTGNGTLEELKSVVKEIQNKVKEMFGIDVEMEANIVE